MNNKPIDKSKKSNVKCEHCNYFEKSNKLRWGFPIMVCTCNDSKWYLQERLYWNRCKSFKWHENKKYIGE